MTVKPHPAWPLPVFALGQVWMGSALIMPLREPGAAWSLVYAALAAAYGLGGLAILAMAVRNCLRMWRMQPGQTSWGLVASTALVALFSAMVAAGPISSGVWRWWALLPGAFAVYLVVVLVRDVRRLLARDGEPSRQDLSKPVA